MGGSAPGERRGGRRAGTPNKHTAQLRAAQAAAAEKVTQALGEAAFTGDGLAFLQAVYKDSHRPVELRLNAAKAAVPFERPRLQSIALAGPDGRPIDYRNLDKLTDEELRFLETIQLKLATSPKNGDASFAAVVGALDDAARAKVLKDFEEIARKVAQEI